MTLNELDYRKESNFSTISYALGAIIGQIHIGVVGVYFFFFYETEVGLNVWLIALATTIFAVWDAFNDPLLGYLTDRPNRLWKRYGKRLPFVILGGIPGIIGIAFLFSPPNVDPVDGAWIYFTWLLSTYFIYEACTTISGLNSSALFYDKFRSDVERRRANGIIMAISLIGMILGYILPPMFVEYKNRQSYTSMAWIFSIVGLIIFFMTIPGHVESKELKERYIREIEEKKRISFWKSLKTVLSSKNFVIVIIMIFLGGIIGLSLVATLNYYTRYVLREESGAVIILIAGFLVGALGSLGPWLIFAQKLNNNRKMFIIGVFLNAIFLLPFFLATDLISATISVFILGLGGGALRIGEGPVLADTIDEATANTEQRSEGAYMGVRTFFTSFNLIVQGLIFAIVHELTGFVPNAENQTELAILGIKLQGALIPMVLVLLGLIVFIKVYDLNPEKTREIQERLRELDL